MFVLYNLIGILLALILSPVILFAFIIMPKLKAGFWEKIGFYRKPGVLKPSIWVHAVSVGEVNAVEGLIKRISQDFPDYNLVLTTVTRTGQEIALKKLSNVANIIAYFPYDFSFSINAAIKAFNPKIVVIAETEIWPNFTNELNKKNIPIVLVNGRISPGSHKGYKKITFLIKNVLNKFNYLLMQSEADSNRIISIGAPAEKTKVMGNLKFDINNNLSDVELIRLRDELKINKSRILIAGSTHKGEDEIILNVFNRLKSEFNDLKLILAPRHPERYLQVEKILDSANFTWGKRSKKSDLKDNEILLLDTMGELGKFYAISSIAFVGGSFSGTGGHNPLEPAVWGIPVFTGPTYFNFKDIYSLMFANESAQLAIDENSLYLKIRNLLLSPESYNNMSKACLAIFDKNRGATEFAIGYIKDILN